MKIVVLGLGVSGKAVRDYLLKRGDDVVGVEGSDPLDLSGVDFVVKSPGIPCSHPWMEMVRTRKIPLMGEIDLALEALQNSGKTLYGITGSNGKTTTTLLTTHLLNRSGKKAIAVGNVGVPVISQIESDADIFVIELSSFQLETIVVRPMFDGGVILNISPNHLDRHPSFKEYAEIKCRLQACLKKGGSLYLGQEEIAKLGGVEPPFETLAPFKEKVAMIFPRLYSHDLENVAAAYALSGVSQQLLKEGVATFEKPPHRLELVGVVDGVTYINDSKATSVDAVIKALESMETKVVLIAGGKDKGGSFKEWIPFCKNKVIKVLAMGEAAERMFQELQPEIDVEIINSLETGINRAATLAPSGTTVLLSPGCSSYDHYKDYQHRGEVFRELVKERL